MLKNKKAVLIVLTLLLVSILMLGVVACEEKLPQIYEDDLKVPPANNEEYVAEKFDLSIETNNSETFETVSMLSGKVIHFNFTKEGYTFGGYFTDAELTLAFTSQIMPNKALQLYVKWIPIV